jgi:hypothetical protein
MSFYSVLDILNELDLSSQDWEELDNESNLTNFQIKFLKMMDYLKTNFHFLYIKNLDNLLNRLINELSILQIKYRIIYFPESTICIHLKELWKIPICIPVENNLKLDTFYDNLNSNNYNILEGFYPLTLSKYIEYIKCFMIVRYNIPIAAKIELADFLFNYKEKMTDDAYRSILEKIQHL